MHEGRGLWRAKRKDNGAWIEGVPYDKYMICGMDLTFGDDEVPMSEYPEFDWVKIDPETLGECTGQRDKNLDLTFEGDILEFHFEDIGWQSAYIVWNAKYACFTLVCCSDDFEYARISDGVIIGNIFDNPNYLERR